MKLITFGVLALLALALLYAYNPANYSIFPKCVFFQLTGLQCPGCGSQRAMHQLLHGDLAEAYHYNALFVVSIPWMSAAFIAHFYKTDITEKLNRIILHKNVVNVYLLIIVFWWIYRNLA